LEQLLAQAADSGKTLKRTLGATNLVALGIGAIIGAGLFVRTAAAAGQAAGPAVVLSFIVAAVGCAFAGLCYAEFASMIPVAGSAYTYAYATMGEVVAWAIGWSLILEYALGAATVAISWSQYLNNLLGGRIPYEWCHSPLEHNAAGVYGIVNVPALIILTLITLILIKGTKESAFINAIIVFIKVSIVLVFIAVGWQFINPANYVPFVIPADAPDVVAGNGEIHSYAPFFNHGWAGVLRGASIVFFAFIGFDAVSTAAQETKNPKRDMPLGILGSLAICTVLYVLFSHVLTGVAPYTDFIKEGKEASVAYAIQQYMHGYDWLATLVSAAILAGFSTVILAMLFGQSRVFFSMSKDGLIPKIFSDLHPSFSTPYKSNLILLIFTGAIAGFVPESLTGNLTSFGTLFAFALVCVGIWIMRKTNPDVERPFRTPLVPLVPILGILVCSALIIGLDPMTQIVALAWIVIGLVIYFFYSKKHSALRN
jgi:APA family basic amino acid/polyamine antiporter